MNTNEPAIGCEGQTTQNPRLNVALGEMVENHHLVQNLLEQLNSISCLLYGPEPDGPKEVAPDAQVTRNGIIEDIDEANRVMATTLGEALRVVGKIHNIV